MTSSRIGCWGSQRVSPGGDVLQADDRGDVAGEGLLDLLALVGVHLQQAADALLLARWPRSALLARSSRPGVDADVGEVAHVLVASCDLEGQGGEGLVVVGLA